MAESNKNARIAWLDLAKLLGMLAIVFGHTVQSGIANTYVYSFHVPLFFFVQGVTFCISGTKNKSFTTYTKRRAWALLVPYYCFAVISTILISAVFQWMDDPQEQLFGSWGDVIWGIISGYCEANRPLWFLPCSFIVSVVGFIFVRITNRCDDASKKKLVFVVFVMLGVLGLYLNAAFFHIRNLFWKMEIVLPMISFFMLGAMLWEFGCFHHIQSAPRYQIVIPAVFLISIGAIGGIYNGRINYLSCEFGKIWIFYVSSIASVLGVCLLSMVLPKINGVAQLGEKTISILLMHKFPVLLFQKVVPVTKEMLARESVVAGVVVTVISIALCCVAHSVLERICPVLIGKKKVVGKQQIKTKQL